MLANDSPRWGRSFALVLLAYAALLSAPRWLPSRPSPPDEGNIQAVMVELAPLPTAPPAPPSELPPGPPQQAQQAQPKPAPKPPEPKPEPKPMPEVMPDVEDPYQQVKEEEPAAEESTQEQAAVAQTTAPPSVDAEPGENYAGHQTVSGPARQQAIASWQGLLLGHLEKHRRYPRQAQRARLQGVSRMRFAVDRQGRISHPRVAESSGHPILDEEALATLLRASPVPPPPPEIRDDSVEVMIPVSFFVRGR